MMNKNELIEMLASSKNISRQEAASTVEYIFGTIRTSLVNGNDVNIGGFGAFKVKERPPRQGINPKTKEKINIDKIKKPTFKPSKALKDAVNN